jgi:hypothetical protein
MTRRSFLALFLALIPLAGKAYSIPIGGIDVPQSNLSDEDMLRRLLDALIPSDDTPGAREARLYERLTRSISMDRKKRRRYEAGLSALRREMQLFQSNELDWDAQWENLPSSPFLRELKMDALHLFYSDPVGWKVVGYQGPPLLGYSGYCECSPEVSFLQGEPGRTL